MQLSANTDTDAYLIAPQPGAARLTRAVTGRDHTGAELTIKVVEERPLTIFLNSQEIVTAMTIGDYPEYLALGFLRNQGMLRDGDEITSVDYDEDLEVVVVRTARKTDYEDKMRKKTRTSGCAVGTVFGDMMEGLEGVSLPATPVHTSWLYRLSAQINRTPSLYLEAGAIHGTILCQGDKPLVYMEDVGRHNAVDKIAGWMMGIPVLASRSGFTAWGVEIANQVGLTLIGRMKGKRFICLAGEDRLVRDADPDLIVDEPKRAGRKGSE
jgi:FdhD protein